MSRFAPENLIFFDFESRSPVPIKAGSYRYARDAEAVILTYGIGMAPTQLVERGGAALSYRDLPGDLRDRFEAGAVFCAWNTTFDRAIWNLALYDAPFMAPGRVIDARAAALAHNLPKDLQSASVRLGGPGKQKDGKKLIAMFCGANPVSASDAPEAWARFCTYAIQDTGELRRVFRLMQPALTPYDWAAYQANEVVNDNGAGVDVAFCREAARLAAEEEVRIGHRLTELTDGTVTSVNQHIRIAAWVHDRLPDAEARLLMATVIKEEAETAATADGAGDDDSMVETVKLTIARGTVERLLDYLQAKDCRDEALMEVLELREFGASAAPKKFQAILDSEIDGRVYGQFQFNGGGQTGRFSGVGVQLQNLTRSTLGVDKSDEYASWEEPTVALITGGCSLEELAAHGNGEAPARKLALTIRPAFIAGEGRTLVRADYSQVEARVLPWLSASSGGEKLLDSFRRADCDPDAPDLYKITAAGMIGKDPGKVTREERQNGKVATLACGFGGGKNALHAMAALYRLHFSDTQAQAIVDAWRAANPWAPKFWGRHNREESYGLFGAAKQAIERPGRPVSCGRVSFVYVSRVLGGLLLCILPSGRALTYPSCRMRDYDIKDKISKQVLETRHGLTFLRARGKIALYGGRFAENITQGAAADLLRDSLVRLVTAGRRVVSHSHDEIVVECAIADVESTKADMKAAMVEGHSWADGLPLAVEMTERWFYSAAKTRDEETVSNKEIA